MVFALNRKKGAEGLLKFRVRVIYLLGVNGACLDCGGDVGVQMVISVGVDR